MNSKEFSQLKHILSTHLDSNAKIIDMGCGSSDLTKWLSKKCCNIVPMTPKEMEHICHENPFVAYNNFINDERKIPVEDTKADVVLLLGPLYENQEPTKRIETIKEVKRLIKDNGIIVTISNNAPYRKAPNKPELIPVEMNEASVLNKAGFVVDKSMNLSHTKKKSEKEEKHLTFATIKPAISKDAVPPEVILQIPNDVLNKLNNQKSIENKPLEEKIVEDKAVKDKTIDKADDNSTKALYTDIPIGENIILPEIPIKPSIDKNLVIRDNKEEIMERHNKTLEYAKVHSSIDKSLQMRLPKINPRYAKPKSRKKGTKNLFKR